MDTGWRHTSGVPSQYDVLCMSLGAGLGALGGLRPQLYAENLKCVASDLALLLTGYVRLVGQEPSPSKRVLRSTSREVGKDVRSWVLSGSGKMDW